MRYGRIEYGPVVNSQNIFARNSWRQAHSVCYISRTYFADVFDPAFATPRRSLLADDTHLESVVVMAARKERLPFLSHLLASYLGRIRKPRGYPLFLPYALRFLQRLANTMARMVRVVAGRL